jgi:hypothetical protein
MKRLLTFTLALGALVVALGLQAPATRAQTSTDPGSLYFPLAKGTTWVFQGMTTDAPIPDSEEAPGTREVTVTMEVTEVAVSGPWVVALMRGQPSDVAFYQEGRAPTEFAIFVEAGGRYYRGSVDAGRAAIARMSNPEDALIGVAPLDGVFLTTALDVDEKVCGPQAQAAGIDALCWIVTENAAAVVNVQGFGAVEVNQVTLRQGGNIGGSTYSYVSGLGPTRFTLVQGDRIITDLRLVEFKRGS